MNIGDMLSRWADGPHVLSNLHRVRMPTAAECGRPRQSIAFFMQADKEAPSSRRARRSPRATTSWGASGATSRRSSEINNCEY